MGIFLLLLLGFLVPGKNLNEFGVIPTSNNYVKEEPSKLNALSGVYINEFMASNNNTDIPGYSGYEDWIEIHNTNNYSVDISGFYITDNLSNPTKARLPTGSGSVVIPKNGYIVIICNGDPALGGDYHVDFGLSVSGEEIGLFDQSQNLVDSIVFGPQLTDISMGRNPGNLNEWKYFTKPTPKGANNLSDSYIGLAPTPIFSHKGGVYTNSFNLTLSLPEGFNDAEIIYSIDGSQPTVNHLSKMNYNYRNKFPQENPPILQDSLNSYTYSIPLEIVDRTNDDNRTSMKSSSYISSNNYFPRNHKVTKGTVVKAIVYKPGYLSLTESNTYFVFDRQDKYSFPIVSVSTDEKHLFDMGSGIYTPGNFSDGVVGYCVEGNFNKNWAKPASFEYFLNGEQVVSAPVELKTHGGCTRSFPQKSLRINGKGNIDYAYFTQSPEIEHRNILLRNGGNNWHKNLSKDALNQEIMRGLNFGIQNNVPSVVFLNGEYWGIHNIRERIDKHYLERIFGADKDNIDLIKFAFGAEVKEGDMVAKNNLYSFVSGETFNYDSLLNMIDIDNFIDYNIAELFLSNNDWIISHTSNNIRMWRARVENFNPEIEGPIDGRWRWILFDTDNASSVTSNRFINLLESNSEEAKLFQKIKPNSQFRQDFSVRYADLLNTSFNVDRIMSIIDDYEAIYTDEIDEHILRWKNPQTKSEWKNYFNEWRSFFTQRPGIERNNLKGIFNLGSTYNLTVNVSDDQLGYIKVNTINILPSTPGIGENPYPWKGKYFQGLTTTLTAVNNKTGKFLHWLKNGSYFSSDLTITFDLTSNQTYTAVFEEHILSGTPYPVVKILDECGYSFTSWPATASENTYPDHMSFVYFLKTDSNNEDHRIEDELGGLYNMNYNRSSQNRINGLGNDGISFINTGSDLGGITDAKLGGAIVAINTLGQDSVFINWTGGTILKNDRKYRIRLQYRIGDLQDFKDLLDENGEVVEYKTNDTPGHEQHFKGILLPVDALDKPYVQLLWRYFYKGSKTSGKRSQLRLDDILITTSKLYDINIKHSGFDAEFNRITSGATIKKQDVTNYTASSSIVLGPGFNTESKAVFKAEIKQCD